MHQQQETFSPESIQPLHWRHLDKQSDAISRCPRRYHNTQIQYKDPDTSADLEAVAQSSATHPVKLKKSTAAELSRKQPRKDKATIPEYAAWLAKPFDGHRCLFVTLTCQQSIADARGHELIRVRLGRDDIERESRIFMNNLSIFAFGKQYKKHLDRRLIHEFFVEKCDAGRWHLHGVIAIPDGCTDEKMWALINKAWVKSKFHPSKQDKYRKPTTSLYAANIRPAFDVVGALEYSLKDGPDSWIYRKSTKH